VGTEKTSIQKREGKKDSELSETKKCRASPVQSKRKPRAEGLNRRGETKKKHWIDQILDEINRSSLGSDRIVLAKLKSKVAWIRWGNKKLQVKLSFFNRKSPQIGEEKLKK